MTVDNTAGVDLTTLFKSCVKTIRTRNKAMGVTLPQTKIFPSAPTQFSQFYSRAKDVMSNIASHRNLLKDHRKKYLQDQDQSMSEYERSYMEKVEYIPEMGALKGGHGSVHMPAGTLRSTFTC